MTEVRVGEDSASVIESLLHSYLVKIEEATSADVLVYVGPIYDPAHDLIRVALDQIDNRRDKLVVILETDGGFAETAERFVRLFRHNYKVVDFIVPGYAMSAGTVLVMSGDAIYMDYSSVLGPIDPQVRRGDDRQVSALGYIEKYEDLIRRAGTPTGLNTAELMYLVQQFDPGDISQYEHARDLTISLLKEWLVKYKFKTWKRTRTRKVAVTARMKAARAVSIARQLGNTKRWHSHGRGIPMSVLENDKGGLNLQIEDFGADTVIGPAVRLYYVLLKDYMIRRAHSIVWQTRRGHHGL